jgi:hypothetical protein
MYTNSLLTTATNLQKQPRDAHKFITDHCNHSSEIAPEMHTTSLPTTAIKFQKLPKDAHKSPPKTVLGKFKGF